MITTAYVKKMATYNQWMNARLYEMAARLPALIESAREALREVLSF